MSNKMTVKDRLKTYRKHPGSFLVMLLVMFRSAAYVFGTVVFDRIYFDQRSTSY